jgi:nucleoside diphosphate kinase
MEQTLVLIKPDGVQRGLVGEIISRLEHRGLRLVAAKFMNVGQELAETHYAIHKCLCCTSDYGAHSPHRGSSGFSSP